MGFVRKAVKGPYRSAASAWPCGRGDTDGLRVTVDDGVAVLQGVVEPAVHDAAVAIAANTTGVVRVRDELVEPRRGRRRAST